MVHWPIVGSALQLCKQGGLGFALLVLLESLQEGFNPLQALILKFCQEGAKLRFDELWRGISGMCYYTLQGGSGGPPPGKFWNLDPLRLILTQFGVKINNQNTCTHTA